MTQMHYDELDLAVIERCDGLRKDAGDTIFVAKELEAVKAKTYDQKFANLNALKLFDMSSEVDPGADTISYQSLGAVGMAKTIANYATDFARVDVMAEEHIAKVIAGGAAYGYSIQDLRRAAMARKPLSNRKAIAARRKIDEYINNIAFHGDAKHGVVGLLDNPNIGNYTVASDGKSDSTKFKDKTAVQILRDMNGIIHSVSKQTNDVENPNTLVLPPDQYNYISSTPYSDVVADSILSVFKRNNPDVTVLKANELTGAGVGGADMMLAYVKDADHQTLEIPLPFTQHTIQQKGLEFEVPCECRTAGVLIYYPLSMNKASGI